MAQLDEDLADLRDMLEPIHESGDTSWDWLLEMVRQKVSDRAREACTPDHLAEDWMFSDLPPLPG